VANIFPGFAFMTSSDKEESSRCSAGLD